MKVKDVIARALRYVGRDDVAAQLENGEQMDMEGAETAETLLYCYNAVEDELARFYFPLVAKESFTGSAGVFRFLYFAGTPIKILSVTSNGDKTDYTIGTDGIYTDSAEITVEYRYAPSKKSMTGDCTFGSEGIGVKLAAAGAASEFCLINGDMRRAEFWESVYRQEIDIISNSKKTEKIYFPPRRWV